SCRTNITAPAAMCRNTASRKTNGTRSAEYFLDFPDRRHLADEREGALVFHFAGAFEKSGKGYARHRAADADAFDAGGRQLVDRQRRIGKAHHEVEGLSNRGDDGADGVDVAHAR